MAVGPATTVLRSRMRTPVSGGGKELKIARTRLRKRRATNYRVTARALKRSGVFANGLQGLHDFEVNQFTGLFFGERHDIVQAQENREPADLLRGHSAQGRVDARGTVKQFRQGDFFHQRLAAFPFRVSRAMQISRSVIIPSTRPFSTTGSVPQPCFQRISATTARLNLGLQNLASTRSMPHEQQLIHFTHPARNLGAAFRWPVMPVGQTAFIRRPLRTTHSSLVNTRGPTSMSRGSMSKTEPGVHL